MDCALIYDGYLGTTDTQHRGSEIIFIRLVSGAGVCYLFRALFPPVCGSSKQQEHCLEPVTSYWPGPAAVSLFTPGEELQAATRLAVTTNMARRSSIT